MFFRSRSRASRRLDPVQAHQRAAHGQAVLLDVRETAEWEAGHAPDALHLPLSRLVAGRPCHQPPRAGRSWRSVAPVGVPGRPSRS